MTLSDPSIVDRARSVVNEPRPAVVRGAAAVVAVSALVVRRSGGAARPVAAVLLGIAGSYVLSRTTGLPVLVPEPERVDLLGALTTAAEVVAAVAVLRLPALRKEHR